ncbi:hypothetical protein BA20089_02765 [Bifidobacterium asteroides DSM 20089]|uniref:Uncharacterized protein n=1 Tax=Bifidobacterium asteroides DSM 20089 TaxID=1437594 RepID=A0AAD0EUI6_9BIFI|nr:hypothetical protein [Bifidobacterium asteroides]AFU71282.1 hypothetical protein BAST_0695 [Bifidobacterium asteroides PRL2011]ATO41194.1 hypothetical protein BA20089_02765 [Bifidobacterium asteroides DSM 20089]
MKQFFHDISWAQIIAGALAAMTSFWLAAKIGVAGSIIGVAIGSIVSAVASQIYKNVLEASGQKLQESVVGSADQDDDDSKTGSNDDSDADGQTTMLPAQGKGRSDDYSDAADGSTQVMAPVDGSTQVMPPVGDEKSTAKTGRTISSINGPRTHADSITATSRKKLDQRHRNVIIVSVVSALVAVLLSALAINALTKGEGTDKVVRNVVSPPASQVVTPSQEEETPSKPAQRTEEPENQPTPGAPQSQPSGTKQNQGTEQGSGQVQQQGGKPTSSPSPSADATGSTPSPSNTASTPQSSPTSTTNSSPLN